MFDNLTENGEIEFDPDTRRWFCNELSLKISEMTEQEFSPVLLCVEPLRYGVKLLLASEGISNIKVLSDVEMNVAVKKMKLSLNIFATIGEDFVPSAENKTGTSVKEKSPGRTEHKKNPNDDLVKLQENLRQILGSLEPFEQQVISMRFGLGEKHTHTLEEVGYAFDIPLEKIRMIEVKALRLLRKNTKTEK